MMIQGIDTTKEVKYKVALEAGEEKLIFKVVNYNEVTNRCYIELQTTEMKIKPQFLVSIDDIQNI